jgi:peptidoglycan-N-acetylglucosamine deacetylase
MYFAKIPRIIQWAFRGFVWRIEEPENTVYLTFDDGPIPEVTPWVLDMLADHGVKATFFCVGENVARYPDLYARILLEGHAVGNHTHRHISGWEVTSAQYLADIEACAQHVDSKLFRPPYGRVTFDSARKLRRLGYQIVLWDVLSCDFDAKLTGAECAKLVLKHTEPGSIIVFHDSVKAWPRLEVALPVVLGELKDRGVRFERL